MDIEKETDIEILLGVPQKIYNLTVQYHRDEGDVILTGVWLDGNDQCIQAILNEGDLCTIERFLNANT